MQKVCKHTADQEVDTANQQDDARYVVDDHIVKNDTRKKYASGSVDGWNKPTRKKIKGTFFIITTIDPARESD
jgi:hypothetical protein